MNSAAKERITGALCAFGGTLMAFFISRMVPYGLGGDIAKVKFYFICMMLAFVMSISSGLAYYYYHAKNANESKDLDQATILAGKSPQIPPNDQEKNTRL